MGRGQDLIAEAKNVQKNKPLHYVLQLSVCFPVWGWCFVCPLLFVLCLFLCVPLFGVQNVRRGDAVYSRHGTSSGVSSGSGRRLYNRDAFPIDSAYPRN